MGTILPETKTGKMSHYCTPFYFPVVFFFFLFFSYAHRLQQMKGNHWEEKGGTCIAHMSPTAHLVKACARVLRMFSRACFSRCYCCFCNCVFLTQNFRTLGYVHFSSLIICQAKISQIATKFEVSSLNPDTNKLFHSDKNIASRREVFASHLSS